MWTAIVKWITGDLVGQLTKAYEAKLKASNETERIIADVAIKDLERQIADRQAAKEIRLSTSGFWEMRLITFLIAGSFTLHLILVSFDTCFRLAGKFRDILRRSMNGKELSCFPSSACRSLDRVFQLLPGRYAVENSGLL